MSSKRFLSGLVVVGLVVGLLADGAFAFRGGRGGARGRSGARRASSAPRGLPSIPGIGNATSSPIRSGVPTLAPAQRNFTPPNRGGTAASRFNGSHRSTSTHQPFTPAWHAAHPNAWQTTHPNAGAAAVAVWLGVGHGDTYSSTVIATPATDETSAGDPSDATGPCAEMSTAPSTTPIADGGGWMPLGSFELKLDGQTVATRLIQLAVDRQGILRGTYYDIAADSTKHITGSVDKATLRASWTIGERGLAVYEMSLDALSSPEGQLTVRYANGQTATWQTSPMSE